jgi:hypothetical protein
MPCIAYFPHTHQAARADACEDFIRAEPGSRRHFFNPVVQFSTTVMGLGAGSPV